MAELRTYDMEPKEFYILEEKELEGGNKQYELTPIQPHNECPVCKINDVYSQGKHDVYIRDLPSFGKAVGIHISDHRYRCNSCKLTFNPEYESIDLDHQMTKRLREAIEKESLTDTFSAIENKYVVSDSTVQRVFADYVAKQEKDRSIRAPRVLGIDENHICRGYRAVFTDIENRLILDMLNNRYKKNVKAWLEALPHKEYTECVTMDMWEPYRDSVYEVFGDQMYVVVDKFHVIKMLTEALDKIRVQLQKSIPEKSERRYLRNARWNMLHNSEDLDEKKGRELYDLFDHYPVFEAPYRLKEAFRDIYACSNRAEAEEAFLDWSEKAKDYPEFVAIIETVNNWYREIFNYFDKRYTNAATESLNNIINAVAMKGRGYSFKVLRAKVLFHQDVTTSKRKFTYDRGIPAPIRPEGDRYYMRMGFMVPFDSMIVPQKDATTRKKRTKTYKKKIVGTDADKLLKNLDKLF